MAKMWHVFVGLFGFAGVVYTMSVFMGGNAYIELFCRFTAVACVAFAVVSGVMEHDRSR